MLKSVRGSHLRRLRVQVLLWTILPLTIFLLAFSLTGIGSHQQSMAALVASENQRLVSAVAAVVAARLDRYGTQVESLAASSQWAGTPPEMTVITVAAERTEMDDLPEWAWLAVAAAQSTPQGETSPTPQPLAGEIVWTRLRSGDRGWLVAGVPADALGLNELTSVGHANAVTSYALVDATGEVITAGGVAPAGGDPSGWAGVAPALAGEHGVLFTSHGARQDVIAYAPVAGTSWALLIREPMDMLTAPLFHFESLLPIVLAAAAMISFLTLYFGLSYIARPLQQLTAQANRIGRGDFGAAAKPVGGLDEIEELRVAIDVMAARLEANQNALQDYVRAVTNIQEEERARLARDLHDETVQTLIALDHKAQMVQRDLERNPERCRAQMAELRAMIAGATQEVRRFSQALRPLYLEDVGLNPALEMLVRDADAQLRVAGTVTRLNDEKELALYRIAQESLNNAQRHANAAQIRVALHFGVAGATLAVGDDGCGFVPPDNPAALTNQGHFGLIGMKERAQLIGGRLDIVSHPGAGTVVVVQVPYHATTPMDELEWRRTELPAWLAA